MRTASTDASSALATVPAPSRPSLSPSAEPTATVEGTSVSTAKNAISAAWPVVRCALAARPARIGTDHALSSLTSTSGMHDTSKYRALCDVCYATIASIVTAPRARATDTR